MRLRSTRRPLARRLAVVAALGLAATGLIAAVPSQASAADAPAAVCPTGSFTFTSELSNGSFKIGKNASSAGAKGSACGSVTSVGGVLTSVVKKENVSFAPTSTKVLFLNLPTTVTPISDLTGPSTLNADFSLDVTLAGSVLVTTKVLGQSCSFPLDLKMTTLKSGALTGTTLKADASGAFAGKLVANEFSVPKWKSSKTCNAVVSTFTNALLGLPLKAGQSSANFDIALKLTL